MSKKLVVAIILVIITIAFIFRFFTFATFPVLLLAVLILSVWTIRKKNVSKETKEIIVIQLNKQTLASFVIGCIGATLGGVYGYGALIEEGEELQPIIPAYFVFIVGLTSGFLSCFYCSKIFLKLIQDRSWRHGIPLAIAFGVLAGGISGFLSGFSWYPFFAPFGLIVGGVIGLVIGIVSWLIFGKLALHFLVPRI